MNEYVRKIGIGNPIEQSEYTERDIKVDSDHVDMATYDASTTAADSLTKKIHDIETSINPATSSTAGVVKPGSGLKMQDGSIDGTLELAYDHTLTLVDESGTTLGTFDGSTDESISVATIPTNHSSINTTYGVGDSNKYGHLKITDTYNDASAAAADAALSSTGANNLYQEVVNKIPQGALIYRGSIVFANIPSSDIKVGDMYNIEDDFTTDSRFQEGAGIKVKAGTNIAWNGTKWDLLAIGGVDELSGLSDVNITSAANKQGLVYDSTAGEWKNGDVLLKDGSVAADNLTVGTRKSGSAIGSNSFACGDNVAAIGKCAHAEGQNTKAGTDNPNKVGAHAEGYDTSATGHASHAEGQHTLAIQETAHAEGYATIASGSTSHAEGHSTIASGENSHSEGTSTIAGYASQHVCGKNNNNKSDTLFEVGNGTGAAAAYRSNAFEVTSDGYIRTKGRTDKIAFGVDSNGNYGYIKAGADTVIPFKRDIVQGNLSECTSGFYGYLPSSKKISIPITYIMYGAGKHYAVMFNVAWLNNGLVNFINTFSIDVSNVSSKITITAILPGGTSYCYSGIVCFDSNESFNYYDELFTLTLTINTNVNMYCAVQPFCIDY